MLKKSLSQNLIKDKNILRKMVSLTGISVEDTVVEIGAGHGDFTAALCEKAGRVYAIELDRSFEGYLEPLAVREKNLDIVFGSVLDIPLYTFAGNKKIKVVGNIPYGITGPIIFKLIDERRLIHSAYLTTQKEIGDRVVSPSHRRTYGALSVACALVARTRMLMHLKPGVFTPPPKVDSVFFSLLFREETEQITAETLQFTRRCFENKRKYLKYALSKYYSEETIADLYDFMGFKPSTRAEEVEPEGYLSMYLRLAARGELAR